MQNEKNLTPEEVRSVITSRERKLTPAQIKSLLTTQLQSMGFTPDTAPDDVYYKACASIVRRILKEKRRHFMADCTSSFVTVCASTFAAAMSSYTKLKSRRQSRSTTCAWSFCWAAP